MIEQDREYASYRYFVTMQTRWMDNDIYGHVNNVQYYSYFDSAANQYLIEHGGMNLPTAEVVGFVVSSNCNYYAPITYPQVLEIGFRVNKVGTTSAEYGLSIFIKGDQKAVASGTFTHVFVNRVSGKPVPVPNRIRKALENVILDD